MIFRDFKKLLEKNLPLKNYKFETFLQNMQNFNETILSILHYKLIC